MFLEQRPSHRNIRPTPASCTRSNAPTQSTEQECAPRCPGRRANCWFAKRGVPREASRRRQFSAPHSLGNPVKYRDPTGHYVAAPDKGEIDLDIIIASYYESGVDTPLVLPIVVDIPNIIEKKIVGRHYRMPVGAQQSTVPEGSPQYTVGRILAGAGIAIDGTEALLALFPGAGTVPGLVDAGVTYLAGVGTGDNYFPLLGISDAPRGLPENMYGVNQDLVVNSVEAGVPLVAAPALGVGGIVIGGATPTPGDELALLNFALVDAATSLLSLAYDSARFVGAIQNHHTIGGAGDEIIIVHWP